LERFGQQTPIVVDSDGIIIKGNATVEAARALGWDSIEVVRTELAGTEQRAYAIADNRSSELAEWDDPGLAEALKDLDAAGVGLESLGFTSDDLAELEASAGPTEIVEDDVPAVQEKCITRRGDLWLLGDHRVLCGDSTSTEDVKRVGTAGLVVTDPPYCSGGFQEAGKKGGSVGTRGTELIHNDQLSTRGYQALMRRVLELAGCSLCYVFTDWRMWISLFDVVEASGFGVRAMLVWDKGSPGMGRGWRSQHELILCGSGESQPFDPKRAVGNVLQCSRTGNVMHATEKPVELITTILTVSDMHKEVFDPMLGSGTTLIAAEQLKRRCYGLEIEPRYCDVICRRWERLTGRDPVRESDGAKFGEVNHG
jgi:DNA modification methylase